MQVTVGQREKIETIERGLLTLDQVDLKTRNVVIGGMIARTITVPAGCALTGATHRKDHVNIVQGDITVSTDDGMKRLIGQHVLPTKAGMKRVGFAHSDTEWTTIVRTDLTDIEEIEAEVVVEAEKLQTRTLQLCRTDLPKLEPDL
jgi:hypothetical protein